MYYFSHFENFCYSIRMKPSLIRLYTENSEFQTIETLRRNRTKRHASGEFFIEGVRAINQALRHQWKINAWIYSREKRLSDWAEGILERSPASRHYELTLALQQKLSQKEDTSELLALAAIPPDDLQRIPATSLVVVLDRPASPGNLGSIIRSCDALGADGLVITGHAADLYDPETIRATTGSFFSLPSVCLPSPAPLAAWILSLKQETTDWQVVGTSAHSQTPLQQHNFRLPTLLLIGNETHGLSQNMRSLCNSLVTIPMSGSATSLNVANAASICLYEIARQRS